MHVESYQKNLHLEVPKYLSSVLTDSYKFFNIFFWFQQF